MIVSFFSNYLTHHQIPFCEELRKLPGVEFYFVSTMPMEQERASGGWGIDNEYPYEVKAYASEAAKETAMQLAEKSDVMIIGSAPEAFVAHRMKNHPFPLTLRYSERIYKGGRWRVLSPRGALIRLNTYFRYIKKPLYMLCASAYTAGDLAMLGSYLGRCYKWGYFTELRRYQDPVEMIRRKEPNSILWVARMIGLKHPEIAVEVARRLRAEGYEFHLDMIGTGELEAAVRTQIQNHGLQEHVHLLGAMKPNEVRDQMERHQIFLFTSDQNEGWGAVLNEAMNSGCAVVANRQIGSVPFLLQDGINGMVYSKKSVDELYCKVKQLLDDRPLAAQMGERAYATVSQEWSPQAAAQRLHALVAALLKGEKPQFAEGPCSKADIFVRK